jgi:putative glycosyltransferase (TIGR04372 family)
VVGNCAEEIYFGLLKARREGKKLVILFPYELPWRLKFRLTNIELVNVASPYRCPLPAFLNAAGRLLLTAYFGFMRSISLLRRVLLGRHLSYLYRVPSVGVTTLWQPEDRMPDFSWEIVDHYNWPEMIAEPIDVSLDKGKLRTAEEMRVRMGLPMDAWFACLHVRESGFHKDNVSDRNADIANYADAIKEITQRGGWVVRMGDASMTPLPPMTHVIDYPYTPFKSELMDVYLISACRVYIGMISGIYDVAVLFQRPIIITNMTAWLFGYPPKAGDLGIMKHIYSKSRGRFLSSGEWFEEPWDSLGIRSLGDDYVLHENTAEELATVVREFFDRGERFEASELQRECNERRVACGKRIIGRPIFAGENPQQAKSKSIPNPFAPDDFLYDMLERYRFGSRLDSAAGMLGTAFLQQNWECDCHERTDGR